MATALGIDRFLRRLARQQRIGRALGILRNHGLVLLAGLLLVELLWPAALLPAICLALLWLLACIVSCLTRQVQIPAADLQFGLKDELVTWRGARENQRESIMFTWLSRQLEDRLVALPRDLTKKISRAPLGRLRYLMPLLILLFLLRLFAPVLPPLPEGRLALNNQSGGGSSAGDGEAETGAGSEGEGENEPQEGPETPSEQPPEPAEDPIEDQGDADPPSLPPKSLAEDGSKDESFLLPSFVGEGESRLSKAPVASIDEGGTGATARKERNKSRGGPMDEVDEKDFERALERALRSRHVPESERPFVRRYFEALMRGGR